MKELKGYIKYFTYVIRHKYYVACACFKMGLYRQGLVHDMSKFLPSEAKRYMKYYSLNDDTVKVQFDLARNYHQKRNKHHWQYWVLIMDSGQVKALDMPEKYIKEMLCDWWGVGRHFHKYPDSYKECYWHEVYNWYFSNRNKMILSVSTRKYIERFLFRKKSTDLLRSSLLGLSHEFDFYYKTH